MLPVRARTEVARMFHRTITNTINVPASANNSLTPINNTIYRYVSTAGQTSFGGTDENGLVLSYTTGRVEVFVNGIKKSSSEYFATNGTSIILLTPLSVSDEVIVVTYNVFSFPNPSDFYYVFLGKTTPWLNDAVAPNITDTRETDADIKNNILAVKRIQPSDTALMIPRVNWETGTIYTSYLDNSAFQDSSLDFYVMNSSFRIYKCIFSPGTASVVEPSHVTVGPFQVSDGYYWQLMYEVPVADRLKFLTEDYIPVKFYSTSTTFDHNGAIDDVLVLAGGAGYVSAPLALVLGDGVGAEIEAVVSPAGEIVDISIINAGYGYSYALVQFIGGGGTGATAEVILRSTDIPISINQDVASHAISTAGAINFIQVVSGGTNYTTSTILNVVGDGVGAIASPIINSGAIVGVDIIDSGSGYTYANIEVFGAGAGAQLRAVIEPQGGHGSNIPQELFATVVGITINIEDVLEDFFLDNDFRQVGLIKNISNYFETENFSSLTGNNCYVITISNPTQFAVDDLINTDDGGSFTVANIRGNQVFLLPIVDYIASDSVLTNETKGINNIFISSLVRPEINTKDGDIIYARNTEPVGRQLGQAEQIKLYFAF